MQTTTTAARLVQAARIAKSKDLAAATAFDTRGAVCGFAISLTQLEAASIAAMEDMILAEEAIVDFKAQTLSDVHAKVSYLNEYGKGCSYDDFCERLVKSACADLKRLCGSEA